MGANSIQGRRKKVGQNLFPVFKGKNTFSFFRLNKEANCIVFGMFSRHKKWSLLMTQRDIDYTQKTSILLSFFWKQ